ncbi:MAG: hypothetical protein V3V08_23320 [Nannocystaceae bacterium]
MAFLAAIAPAIGAVSAAASVGLGIASAVRSPPKPPAIPAPNVGDPNAAGRLALGRERLRRGRRSTILTGASALLDAEELDTDETTVLGG